MFTWYDQLVLWLQITMTDLLVWIKANPELAGLIVFTMAMLESLAIVGMLVPGMLLLFGVGALIGTGTVDFYTIVFWAVLGAILGDALSYVLGRIYHKKLVTWPIFVNHQNWLIKAEHFFVRYGMASIIVGRFFGPIRALVPLVAGMLEMPSKNFFAANIISALLWAPAFLLPGMLIGASLEADIDDLDIFVVYVACWCLALWFLLQQIFRWFNKPDGFDKKRSLNILLMMSSVLIILGWFMLDAGYVDDLYKILQQLSFRVNGH